MSPAGFDFPGFRVGRSGSGAELEAELLVSSLDGFLCSVGRSGSGAGLESAVPESSLEVFLWRVGRSVSLAEACPPELPDADFILAAGSGFQVPKPTQEP